MATSVPAARVVELDSPCQFTVKSLFVVNHSTNAPGVWATAWTICALRLGEMVAHNNPNVLPEQQCIVAMVVRAKAQLPGILIAEEPIRRDRDFQTRKEPNGTGEVRPRNHVAMLSIVASDKRPRATRDLGRGRV
jgi:hypothetical protein